MNPQDQKNIETIENSINLIKNYINYENSLNLLNEIIKKTNDQNFWDNPQEASKIMKDKDNLENLIKPVNFLQSELDNIKELIELAELELSSPENIKNLENSENNDNNTQSLMDELQKSLEELADKSITLQIESILNEKYDNSNCFLEINAGAGGTEAQDWAEMLARMYSRWAEKKGYKIEITDKNNGDEAGVKSITLYIKGHNAYGWLKKESGVHRLVRISPFDSNARRHTSFASVFVTPEVDKDVDIQINESDLRIDTYRASGAGGQHVNKTESAVRITHIPTGFVTQSQVDRSQHKNKEIAMNMLRAKLYSKKLQENENELNSNQNKTDIAWGNQIRSYVLQPYQLVKDNRTGVEKGDANSVLDGEINEFLEAAISFIQS